MALQEFRVSLNVSEEILWVHILPCPVNWSLSLGCCLSSVGKHMALTYDQQFCSLLNTASFHASSVPKILLQPGICPAVAHHRLSVLHLPPGWVLIASCPKNNSPPKPKFRVHLAVFSLVLLIDLDWVSWKSTMSW